MRLQHEGGARPGTLGAQLGGTTTDLTITGAGVDSDWDGWPDGSVGPFWVSVNRQRTNPEKILCDDRTGKTFSVWTDGMATGRAGDGTSISVHEIDETLEHVFVSEEADAANAHIEETDDVHGATGAVIGLTDLTTILAGYSTDAELTAAIAAAVPKSLIDAAGDLIYGSGADAVARLPLGTAGKVLAVNAGATAPEWQVLTSGDFDLVSFTSIPSGAPVSAINFDSLAADETYRVVMELVASGSITLSAQVRAAAANIATATYNYVFTYFQGSGENSTGLISGGTSIQIANLTAEGNEFTIDIARIGDAAPTRIIHDGGGQNTNPYLTRGRGVNTNSTAYTGIGFILSSGTVYGKVWLYKRRKA